MDLYKLVAHARGDATPLWNTATARALWHRLQRAFPDADCVLMPNHTHLSAFVDDPELAHRKLRGVLASVTRSEGVDRLWLPIPPPELVTGSEKKLRLCRYDALNVCRRSTLHGRQVVLVSDPLCWPWSTYRDILGASADPWVTPERLAELLGARRTNFREWYADYVTEDAHVTLLGPKLPAAAASCELPRRTFEDVVRAVESATRLCRSEARRQGIFRDLLVGLAYDQGWGSSSKLAAVCGTSDRSIRRRRHACSPDVLRAAKVCLGDPRLLITSCEEAVAASRAARSVGRPIDRLLASA